MLIHEFIDVQTAHDGYSYPLLVSDEVKEVSEIGLEYNFDQLEGFIDGDLITVSWYSAVKNSDGDYPLLAKYVKLLKEENK